MMQTVDWSSWMNLTTEQQSELVTEYKRRVRQESEAASQSNYAAMNAALKTGKAK